MYVRLISYCKLGPINCSKAPSYTHSLSVNKVNTIKLKEGKQVSLDFLYPSILALPGSSSLSHSLHSSPPVKLLDKWAGKLSLTAQRHKKYIYRHTSLNSTYRFPLLYTTNIITIRAEKQHRKQQLCCKQTAPAEYQVKGGVPVLRPSGFILAQTWLCQCVRIPWNFRLKWTDFSLGNPLLLRHCILLCSRASLFKYFQRLFTSARISCCC